MKTQTTEATRDGTENLSHREAVLVLDRTDLDKHADDLGETEQAAVNHYLPTLEEGEYFRGRTYDCKICAEAGLGGLLEISLSCQKAIEVFAQLLPLETIFLKGFGSGWPGWGAETLRQLIAFEHIWGRPQFEEPSRHDHVDVCGSDACYEVTKICNQAGRTHDPRFDGSSRKVLSRLVELFDELNWPKDTLLKLQLNRVRSVLEEPGNITAHDKREVLVITTTLQGLVKDGK